MELNTLQVKGRTPSQSGIDIIPFMLAVVVASFASGGIVNGIGHYLTFIIIGPMIAAVGTGLLFTIKEDTSGATLVCISRGVDLTLVNSDVLKDWVPDRLRCRPRTCVPAPGHGRSG